MAQRKYDSTVARIAGNLLSSAFDFSVKANEEDAAEAVAVAVAIARAIVAEVERTEPKADEAS